MKWKRDRITYMTRLITNHILELGVGERLLIISEREHTQHGKNLRTIAYSRLMLSRIRKTFKNATLLEYTALHSNSGFMVNEPPAVVWDTVFGTDFRANLPNNTYFLVEDGHLAPRLQSLAYRAASANDRAYDVVLHIGNTNLDGSLFKALFAGVQAGRLVSIRDISLFASSRLHHLEMFERKTQYLASSIVNAAKTTITSPQGTNLALTFHRSSPYIPDTTTARTPSNSTHLPVSYLSLTPSNANIHGTIEGVMEGYEDILLTLTITNNLLQGLKVRKNKKFEKHPSLKIFDNDPFLGDVIKMKYLKKPVFSLLTIQETSPYESIAPAKGSHHLIYKSSKFDKININSDLSLNITFKQELRSYTFWSKSISVEISKDAESPINIILNTVE